MDQLNGCAVLHSVPVPRAYLLFCRYEIAGMAIKVGLVNETPAAGGFGGDENLDDTEGGGMQLTAQSRAMLMARLQRDPNAAAAAAPAAPAAPGVPNDGLNHDPGCTIAPMPQRCILLRNMYDPRTEREPDFDQDIKEDVGEECGKYGQVQHIAVDKTSAGFVFVKFDSVVSPKAIIEPIIMRLLTRNSDNFCEYLHRLEQLLLKMP